MSWLERRAMWEWLLEQQPQIAFRFLCCASLRKECWKYIGIPGIVLPEFPLELSA